VCKEESCPWQENQNQDSLLLKLSSHLSYVNSTSQFVTRKSYGTSGIQHRALNNFTVKDKCPIPREDELFDRLRGATHFSTIDMRSGYYQIWVREKDVPKTCIRTRYGSHEFMVMPFVFTNAPITFQALMNNAFRDCVDKIMLVYLDDILIFSRSAEEHKEHVELVLKRLRDEKLIEKQSKCEFNKPSVTFLGHC
jgi:Reverse transcriptase (RNA-dependent DNA polymerase)